MARLLLVGMGLILAAIGGWCSLTGFGSTGAFLIGMALFLLLKALAHHRGMHRLGICITGLMFISVGGFGLWNELSFLGIKFAEYVFLAVGAANILQAVLLKPAQPEPSGGEVAD